MYPFFPVAYILTTKAQNSQVEGHSRASPSFILCSQPAKSFPHVFSKLKITGVSRYSSTLKHITNCTSNDVNPKLVASVCIQIFIPGTSLSNDTSRPSIEGKVSHFHTLHQPPQQQQREGMLGKQLSPSHTEPCTPRRN